VPWEFYCTAGRNSGVWTTIAVPSCWEQQGFGTYDYGVEFRPNKRLPEQPKAPDEVGHYRHTFHVPADWQGRDVRLVFEGVLTDADVKLNGQSVGTTHQGGFYRFSFEVASALRYGAANLLEVTVHKRSANASVNTAERIGDYWNFGGIFRPVWLEVAPAESIARVAIDGRADGAFRADVFLRGRLPADGEVVAQIKTLAGEPVGPAARTPLSALTGEKLAVQTQVPSPATWSAETPSLYVAEFTLRRGDTVLHTLTQRFGFRTFEVRPGDGLYLNGRKIVLKGFNRHSFWPDTGRTLSPERHREDVRLMKEINANAVRMSHYPPDPEFLDLCDEAGLYVLNELGGWQGHYDTPTGAKLIASMVQRDVNHPSILFWDNGNEGGENPENDDTFALHDPQKRPVLHPWAVSFRGMNTKHYREYAETAKFTDGPEIYMPTEFLHGLFDGGHGAGLDDFWPLMSEKPHAAGGFLWSWMDEAVARTDENGRLDARRDLAPDGILGPRHEKEGSYYTVREIWSPVQIPARELPGDFAGSLPVRNRYDFLNLRAVTFEWRLFKFAPPGAPLFHRTLLAHGRLAGPDVPARAGGTLALPLPADWREADALILTAFDGREREIGAWSWRWKSGAAAIGQHKETKSIVELATTDADYVVTVGRNTMRFDRQTGLLRGLTRDGRPISLGQGPRLVAYKRTERVFEPVASTAVRTRGGAVASSPEQFRFGAAGDGALRSFTWTVSADGDLRLDYEIAPVGPVDLLGLDFDYPEEKMRAKEWFGQGPYRVWANRLKGGTHWRWDTDYNDPVPGASWSYPEFKGWFARWEWMSFTTTEGRFTFLHDGGAPYVGAYSPRDGKNNPVLTLPRLGLGVYQVIPAIGTKGSLPSNLGPQGEPKNITAPVKGSLIIRLLDQQ
jgi:hypothetical protein